MSERRPRVAFHTLGCKVNQYDTQAIAGLFKDAGYEIVGFEEEADVYVINTCTVTNMGDRKSRQVIRRAMSANPDGLIVVTGCYAQTSPDEVMKIPGVALVIGTDKRHKIVELVEEAKRSGEPINIVDNIFNVREFEEIPIDEVEERSRASVKIQDGCQEFCSYCRIPYARGPIRSRDPKDVYDQVKRLVEKGYMEVVLTGIHLGAYGRERRDGYDLVKIIKDIHGIEGLERIRISSIDPTEVGDGLIELVSDYPKVCRHLHIPLQNGSDRILRLMNRKYTTEEYYRIIERVRERVEGIGITTDIIVGFPQESDEDFEETLRFVRRAAFSRIHVFKYSKRSGTPAARMSGQVDSNVKAARSRRLIELAEELSLEFHRKMVGEDVEVLVEGMDEGSGKMEGLTDTYVRVRFDGSESHKGSLVSVKVYEADREGVFGRFAGLVKARPQ